MDPQHQHQIVYTITFFLLHHLLNSSFPQHLWSMLWLKPGNSTRGPNTNPCGMQPNTVPSQINLPMYIELSEIKMIRISSQLDLLFHSVSISFEVFNALLYQNLTMFPMHNIHREAFLFKKKKVSHVLVFQVFYWYLILVILVCSCHIHFYHLLEKS